MIISRKEVIMLLELVKNKLAQIDEEITVQQNIVYSQIERGIDTTESNRLLDKLDRQLGEYSDLCDKLESKVNK